MAHFIHDSVGIGWGVQWLYPFKKDHYSFFYQYDTYSKIPKKLIYVWKDGEIERLEREYGNPNWFHDIYLRGHPYGLVEYAVFLAALVALYVFARS